MEFSKSDKKIARILIQKGLMKEFAKGLNKADEILNDWKQGKGDAKASYHALFEHIRKFDKDITRRYDSGGNFELPYIIVHQLSENLIEEQDLEPFSVEGKAFIQRILTFRDM